MAYVETLYMKAQLKQEIKELRRLKREPTQLFDFLFELRFHI